MLKVILISTSVWAAEAWEEESAVLVVRSTRAQRAGDQVASRILVLDEEDLANMGAQNLGEALDTLPGVRVQQGYRGAELSLRGLDPQHTLVLVDGQRLSGRTAGAVDLSRISLQDVVRVEVIKGPQSALYGSDAMGGVVKITTRGGSNTPQVRGQLAVASSLGQGTPTMDADLGASGGKDALSGSIDLGLHGGQALMDTDGVHTAADQWRQGDLSLSGAWRPESGPQLRVRSAYSARMLAGVDSANGGASLDRTVGTETQVNQLGLSWAGERSLTTVRAGYSLYLDQYLSDQRKAVDLDLYERSREDLWEGGLLHERSSPLGVVSVGADVLVQQLQADRLEGAGNRSRISPFAQLEYRPIENLLVVPALRTDLDSQFGRNLSPKLSALWYAPGPLQLRVSYGQGFREPSFSEQLLRFSNPSAGYQVEGNPDLGPESSQGLDVELRRPIGPFGLSAAGWWTLLDDMIAVDDGVTDTSGTTYRYVNVDQARTRGVELGFSVDDGPWSLQLDYVYTQSVDFATGKPLVGRAPHVGNGSLIWSNPLFRARTQVAAVGARPMGASGTGPSGTAASGSPYALWDAQIAWTPGPVDLRVGVENLLNTQDNTGLVLLRPRELVFTMGRTWGSVG
jgi:outer membrane receptor for ferrienterochelin and colicins